MTKAGRGDTAPVTYFDHSIRSYPKWFASQPSFGPRHSKGLCDAISYSCSSSLSTPCTRYPFRDFICVDRLLNQDDVGDVLSHQASRNEVWFKVGAKLWNVRLSIGYGNCRNLLLRLSLNLDRFTSGLQVCRIGNLRCVDRGEELPKLGIWAIKPVRAPNPMKPPSLRLEYLLS